MLAWLIYFRDAAGYNEKYIEFFREEGSKLGVNVRLVLVDDIDFGIDNNKLYIRYKKENIVHPDFAISRAIYPLLTKHLEDMNIPVYNNSFVSEISNDKARTYQYLAKTGIRMINTDFCTNSLLQYKMDSISESVVVKAVEGHGGSKVFIYEPDSSMNVSSQDTDYKNDICINQMGKILQGMGNSHAVIQPLIGHKHQDLRVYVVGKEIIAAVLRTAKEGFRSNYSLGGDVEMYELSKTEKLIVNTIIEQFDFGLVGIDFIIGDDGELYFNEIEDVVGSRMLYKCSDINIVRCYLEYICSRI